MLLDLAWIFLLVTNSIAYKCPSTNESLTCQGRLCYFSSKQTAEGLIQWADCHVPRPLVRPLGVCGDTIASTANDSIHNICIGRAGEKFCCCQGDDCNKGLITRHEYVGGDLDDVRHLCYAIGILGFYCLVYSLLCYMLGDDRGKPELQLPPNYSWLLNGIYIIQNWTRLDNRGPRVLCHTTCPLKPECSPPEYGRFVVPLEPLFALGNSATIAMLLVADVFFAIARIRQTEYLAKTQRFPFTAAIDQVLQITTMFAWNSLLIYTTVDLHELFVDGPHCNYDAARNVLSLHNVIILVLCMSEFVLMAWLGAWLWKRRKVEPSYDDQENSDDSGNCSMSSTQGITSDKVRVELHGDLAVEPEPMELTAEGDGLLTLTNCSQTNWMAIRVFVSIPAQYRISPRHLLIPPARHATVEFNYIPGPEPTNGHSVMLEWFDAGRDCPTRDAEHLWARPHLIPREKWSHVVLPIFHEPATLRNA